MNGRDNSPAAPTALAFKDFNFENASHEFGPGIVAWTDTTPEQLRLFAKWQGRFDAYRAGMDRYLKSATFFQIIPALLHLFQRVSLHLSGCGFR
jgi:hypothetical protein